ncbi:epoxide hydrolase-like protein [Zopfia rhizophila CBS 207.26]|uniref:Epoxide hydrolase-like protein n=1 Tax=Zopfia rhizophila CBS 207.26 TaxID=1314779 RepID=A0A6A6EF23_9PEZI|nr:epoxide hydrolase-like protein [Zopfia rhizophila CBS 207.26]
MSYSPPSSAVPFTLNVSDKDFSEFRQLLQLSRIGPLTWEGKQDDRRFGVTHQWLTEAKDYWLNKYNWRAQEMHINSFSNYKMAIQDEVGGDLSVHFVGMFSEKKDAIPIVLMHGWPGSFLEFLPMLGLVRGKYSPSNLPYHLVVPSLPGYTLSSGGPLDRDWSMDDTARVIDKVMKNLGFNKYIAQGGDVGSFVGRLLATDYDSCAALHLNFTRIAELPDANEPGLSEAQKKGVARAKHWRETGMAYAMEHGSRPSTISLVLSSNPLALLAWIGEKMLEWTDDDPSLDTILTNVSLYWFTQGFPRSIYPYRKLIYGPRAEPPYVQKPLGFSWFPMELGPMIKSLAEKQGNMVFYRKHEKGGHFAALEQPKELLEDVEDFVKAAWKV